MGFGVWDLACRFHFCSNFPSSWTGTSAPSSPSPDTKPHDTWLAAPESPPPVSSTPSSSGLYEGDVGVYGGDSGMKDCISGQNAPNEKAAAPAPRAGGAAGEAPKDEAAPKAGVTAGADPRAGAAVDAAPKAGGRAVPAVREEVVPEGALKVKPPLQRAGERG